MIIFEQLSLSISVSSRRYFKTGGFNFSQSIIVRFLRHSGSKETEPAFLFEIFEILVSIVEVSGITAVVVDGFGFKLSSPGRMILSSISSQPWLVAFI